MSTQYISPTGTQSYNFWRMDLCMICGTKRDASGCLCRYCGGCSAYWKADTRKEGSDGAWSAREECPDCAAYDLKCEECNVPLVEDPPATLCRSCKETAELNEENRIYWHERGLRERAISQYNNGGER